MGNLIPKARLHPFFRGPWWVGDRRPVGGELGVVTEPDDGEVRMMDRHPVPRRVDRLCHRYRLGLTCFIGHITPV